MRRRHAMLLLVLSALLAPMTPAARADGPSAGALADTLRYDPESPGAALVLERLGRLGEKGWKTLASLAISLAEVEGELAAKAVDVLVADDERARLAQAARVYDRVEDDELRRTLALGLATIYPDGAERLHAHVRRCAPGSLDLLRGLAGKGLPREEIEAALKHEPLVGLATSLLGGRATSFAADDLLPQVRKSALHGLDPVTARAFATEFRSDPYLPVLRALAEVLREPDADARSGAHCLLLTVSGRDLAPDADLWHSWLDGQTAGYLPPDPVSRGSVAAAVQRAVRHLQRDLAADGFCRHAYSHAGDTNVGATALAVLALRAAGVPADDPALVKGVETSLLVYDRGGRPGLKSFPRRWETYTLALLAMALKRLGGDELDDALGAIRGRLAAGILGNGQWTYTCPSATAGSRPATGDNSNTQYANLGLRALRAAGIELPAELWSQVDAHWRGTQQMDGVWGYRVSGRDHRRGPLQMTASGVAGLAIGHEGLDGGTAAERIAADESIRRGLAAMGRYLLLTDHHLLTAYTLYAVERACVLTRTRAFAGAGRTLDWYREGAWRLLRTQNADGSWGVTSVRTWERQGFGKVPSTAFALLFLTKATATIGDGIGEKIVAVSVTPEEVATPPPNRAPEVGAEPVARIPWQRPEPEGDAVRLELEAESLATKSGKAAIHGRVSGPWSSVEVGGAAASVDETGRFALRVTVEETSSLEVVAYGSGGRETKRAVRVVLDRTPPKITLVGPAVRHVGKQRLILESSEILDGAKVGPYYFPADGRRVHVTVELGEATRQLVVLAYDAAGNKTRAVFPLSIVNRSLVLDGKSAVRVDLRSKPARFTLECWVRAPVAKGQRGLVADTENAGCGLFLSGGAKDFAKVYLRDGGQHLVLSSKRPLKPDRWTHLAATCDGRLARLWVDGRLDAEAEVHDYRRSGKSIFVGAQPDRRNRINQPLTGALDEVRLSDVVRYTESFRPAFSHLADRHTLVLLHFDTDTATAVLDDSGGQHNGTPVGSPQIVAEKR